MLNLIFVFQAPGLLPQPIPSGRFYRGTPEEGKEVNFGAIDKILELHKKMSHIKSPLGTRSSPAKSCLDMYLQDSTVENGISMQKILFLNFVTGSFIV